MFLAVLMCAGSLIAAAHAASMSSTSQTSQLATWFGSWACTVGDENRTMTFSPLFGGRAMRISETGSMPVEEIVTFDAKRHKWVNQHAQASGAFATFEGTQNGNTIVFSQVYPATGPLLTITRTSKNTFTSAFTATIKGKKISNSETCKKI
jgi:hypothetical protein